jgi:diguanylate cyclase (GGDEF)-like protein/PAS domain S-box-containing protein
MNNVHAIVLRLLLEADVLLQGLFDNTLIGVYIIQDGRFLFANPRFAEMFGYTQEEICSGLSPMDLTMQEDRPLVQREIERRFHGESNASSYNFHAKHKNGHVFEIEAYGTQTQFSGKPAILGITHDLSARRKAEHAVADQLRFIERLIDTIPSPLFYKDVEGHFLGCNTAFERFIGYEREKIIGHTSYDIASKDWADFYFSADKDLLEHPGLQSYETNVAYANGTRHDVVMYKATFNKSDGSLGGIVGVIFDISDRKKLEATIWHEANYDALTGLPNRRLLQDRLTEELKRAKRNSQKLSLLFLDLDHFKQVNDTFGHNAGDTLLIEAAHRIRAALRASDTAARLGGDEFLIILSAITERADTEKVAQKIIRELELPYDLGGQIAHVSASIGIALFPDDSTVMENLIRFAD